MLKVAVVLGSDSDLPTMKPCFDNLTKFGVPYEVRIISAHRTPEQAHALSQNARSDGFGIIIAAAGKAAHLAGVLAASTTLPVIGVPVKSSTLDGLDALLSTVQMPSGIPVATVAIDGAANAAILACRILSLTDPDLAKKLDEYRSDMEKAVLAKDEATRKEYSSL